jgi:hypothetical protein|eukprot:SAG25_NODE_1946_length_2110_cov_1.935356_4_plen_45_part_00
MDECKGNYEYQQLELVVICGCVGRLFCLFVICLWIPSKEAVWGS